MAQVKSFPGMPANSAKLLNMLKDPDSSAAEIEDVLKYDPGMTANILKLTNSAYFGIPTKVSSVKQAVVLLGWKRLLQLVMTLCMSTVMKKAVPGYDLSHGELWRHSVAVSVAAELVVKALRIPGADEVFTHRMDFTFDGIVDSFDLSLFADQWLQNNDGMDFNDDDVVDYIDYAYFASTWYWKAKWYVE